MNARTGLLEVSIATRVVALLIAGWCLCDVRPAVAEPRKSVSVPVRIEVDAMADISFPQGKNFLIRVPRSASPNGATITPVRIGFTVRGNALASVSVAPDAFMRVADGSLLGEAHKQARGSDGLGYNVVIQFPVPSPSYSGLPGRGGFGSWPRRPDIAHLTGREEGTPALSVDMSDRGGIAYGTIHIVARHDWTPSGRNATPGDYTGSVEVTLVANDK